MVLCETAVEKRKMKNLLIYCPINSGFSDDATRLGRHALLWPAVDSFAGPQIHWGAGTTNPMNSPEDNLPRRWEQHAPSQLCSRGFPRKFRMGD